MESEADNSRISIHLDATRRCLPPQENTLMYPLAVCCGALISGLFKFDLPGSKILFVRSCVAFSDSVAFACELFRNSVSTNPSLRLSGPRLKSDPSRVSSHSASPLTQTFSFLCRFKMKQKINALQMLFCLFRFFIHQITSKAAVVIY